jgi:hypothetical protein
MTLSSIFSRLVKGNPHADRLAEAGREISEAREKTRLNTVVIDSGDRALRRMTGMMRMLQENNGGKVER